MEDTTLMNARGINGTLELLPDRIRIRREGWVASFYKGHTQTELSLLNVSSLELRNALGGLAGYLAIHDIAGQEGCDDLCVSFMKPQQPAFEAMEQAIQQQRTLLVAQKADHGLLFHHADVPAA